MAVNVLNIFKDFFIKTITLYTYFVIRVKCICYYVSDCNCEYPNDESGSVNLAEGVRKRGTCCR